ncbi:unnamed protein product [Spodoptera exigua]|nr:unnamed protein product [Spodoptera exigua]
MTCVLGTRPKHVCKVEAVNVGVGAWRVRVVHRCRIAIAACVASGAVAVCGVRASLATALPRRYNGPASRGDRAQPLPWSGRVRPTTVKLFAELFNGRALCSRLRRLSQFKLPLSGIHCSGVTTLPFETQQRHRFRTIEDPARCSFGCGVDHATLAQLRDLTTPRRASRDRGRE